MGVLNDQLQLVTLNLGGDINDIMTNYRTSKLRVMFSIHGIKIGKEAIRNDVRKCNETMEYTLEKVVVSSIEKNNKVKNKHNDRKSAQ